MTQPPVHLTCGGVSLVVTMDEVGGPVIAHWGAALGDLTAEDLTSFARLRRPGIAHSSLDQPRQTGIVPESVRGFTGTPALTGMRLAPDGSPLVVTPRLDRWRYRFADSAAGSQDLVLAGDDAEAGWAVRLHLGVTDAGLVRMRTTVTNSAAGDLILGTVGTVVPVGSQATELLDLTGRWCKERAPQRHPWVQGSFVRAGRHGRTGHDATLLMVAGTPGFGFRHGEVWGVHTAWSGDHTTYAERTPEGDCLLGGGELLGAGEVVLAPGESYASPWLLASYSATGLDAMSARLHAWIRQASPRTRGVRKVVVNTWEAVYFDHDLDRLTQLADRAAEVGAERFVLDDGWFRGRVDDHAGLGDWTVDPRRWPRGLHPLIDRVHQRDMDFGLWVEPEMVNLDSDLARAHPDWILRGRKLVPPTWRHQQVLDLQHPEAYAYVRGALLALLGEYDIAYLKWDHNRDLVDVAHAGRPAVHGQTLAYYRLLDELRIAHPRLEIESCASGGGRVDAEVLSRTDRIWPSDTIDATERQALQRWTSLLVPPELMGSHLGGPTAHTTGRTHCLGFRAATGLLCHFGIEWDLTALSDRQIQDVRVWVDLHKRIRPIIGAGTLVRADHPDPAILVHGIVAADRREAWYVVAVVATTATQHPTPVRLPGLDAHRRYLLTDETPASDQLRMTLGDTWSTGFGSTGFGSTEVGSIEAGQTSSESAGSATAGQASSVIVSGGLLIEVGACLPPSAPETARVWHAVSR
ncbi:MAG: alpha-galactosidase [Nocardioides sp.]